MKRGLTGTRPQLDRSLNAAGAHTTGTGVDMSGRTRHNRLDSLYVGFPHPVRPSVGVADFDAEGDTLIAISTFCHLSHLLLLGGQLFSDR